jgi:hypothetical protein
LRNPEIEPTCLNVLLKVLMKKALFKPNSKVYENFEFSKLQEMLLKKINYFYKTYIRYLKRFYNENDNNKIYDLIQKDIAEGTTNMANKFSFSGANLGQKVYDDLDLKNLMIIDFFRNLGGVNPFLKVTMVGEQMENYLKQDDADAKGIETAGDLAYCEDYLSFNDLSLKHKVEVLHFFCK